MSEFIKYQHVEKLGTEETDGIEIGTTYVFPKLDGTNGSLWLSEDGVVKAGSRNRELALDNDNAGFYNAMIEDYRVKAYLAQHPFHVLYGEWLVPHTLKTYDENAWRKFYVFDVLDKVKGRLLSYAEYKDGLEAHQLDYLAPIAIVKNGNAEVFMKCLEKNVFLIKDGAGVGEGVVIKNYDFFNKYGRQTWAKVITNEFKEKHHKAMGAPEVGHEVVESKIVEKYVTPSLVNKIHAKIMNERGGWSQKYIPQLLHTTYYDLIREESWEFIKEFKNPKVDFRALNHFTTAKVKELRPDIF